MSTHEIEPRPAVGPDPSNPAPPDPSSISAPENVIINIGSFVTNYNKMAEVLYPLELVSTSILYIVRWENYILTLTTLVLLCILFYHPGLLAGSVVGVSIVGMAVGKYYSQSKLNALLRRVERRDTREVQYLNEDSQALKKCMKDQKASHKLLLEYRRVMCNAEAVINMVTRALEYVYKIILWESLEVSLCVTVLLCVLFALLCTVYLRVFLASFPLIVLCFNRHFINRTVELWKSLLNYTYRKVRLKRRESKADTPSAELEVVHHSEDPQASQDQITEEVPVSEGTPESQVIHTSSGGLGQDGQTTAAARGSHVAANGNDGTDKEGVNPSHNIKGFCTKCSTSFAKLLKRKHDCNYCGQSFCGSCTVKVKRAVLGATSPAAFEESVRVCLDCKHLLDDLKLAQNSIPAS